MRTNMLFKRKRFSAQISGYFLCQSQGLLRTVNGKKNILPDIWRIIACQRLQRVQTAGFPAGILQSLQRFSAE